MVDDLIRIAAVFYTTEDGRAAIKINITPFEGEQAAATPTGFKTELDKWT